MPENLLDFSAWATAGEDEDAFATPKALDFSKQAKAADGRSASFWPDPEKTGLIPDPTKPEPTPKPKGAPRFDISVDEAIDRAAETNGVDPSLLRTFARIESGGRPDVTTGSYKGLFQLSDEEFRRNGGRGDIYDPMANADAAARKLRRESEWFANRFGREPTVAELYMIHQQGVGGALAHWENPEAPAWQNMLSTAEGRQKGERWAKLAIWGNVPDDVKARFGSVENITSRDFLQMWEDKVARLGSGAAPRPATESAEAPSAPAQGDLLRRVLSAQPNERAKIVEDYLYESLGIPRPKPKKEELLDFSDQAVPLDFSDLAVDPAKPQGAERASFGDAFGRGVDIAQQLGYGAVEAFGEATGLEGLTQWGREGRERNFKEAQQYAPRQQFVDIKGIGDFIQWAKETVGEQIPIMAPILAGSAAGAAMGAPLGPLGVTIGGMIGAFVPGWVLGTGEVQSAIKEKDPKAVAPGWAFAGGTAIAALDSILPGKVGSALVKAFGKETAEEVAKRALTKPVKEGWIKTGAKGTAKGMAVEGVTEAIQEAIAEVAAAQATGKDIDPNLGRQMLEAGAAGALFGGLMGGPTAIIEGAGKDAGDEKGKDQLRLPPPEGQQKAQEKPKAKPSEPPPAAADDVAILKADGWSDEAIADMDPEEIAATAADARARGVQAAPVQKAPDQPSAEPVKDLVAQARDMLDPKKPRRALYLSRDNLEALLNDQKGSADLIQALSKGSVVSVDNFDDRGGMLVVPDDETAQWAVDQKAAGRDIQEILGELTGAGTGKPVDGSAVVQQVTPEGAVTRESLVTEDQVAATEKEFAEPGRDVRTVTPEDALARRRAELEKELTERQTDYNWADDADGRRIAKQDMDRIRAELEKLDQEAAQPAQPAETAGDGSRQKPVKVQAPEDLDRAAERVQEPTEAQAEAGNYRKGHVKIGGLNISIETPRGAMRRGKSADGTPWEVEMPAHYGYVRGTEGRDGDQVDVYVGDAVDSDRVWVVDQVDAETSKFDEHKAFLGFTSEDEVRAAYEAAFSDGRAADRFGGITEMPLDEFKQWLAKGKRTRRLSRDAKEATPASAAEAEEQAPPPAPAPAGDVPTFAEVMDALPKDENGDPNVVLLANKIRELTDKRAWNQLTDDEKIAVWSEITGEPIPEDLDTGPEEEPETQQKAPETGPSDSGVTFRTAKGSKYTVQPDGTTVRDKAARDEPGHEGDSGIKPKSDRTVYVTPENAEKLGEFQAQGGSPRALGFPRPGYIGIWYLNGKDRGKYERRTIVPFETEPRVGLIPVEIWDEGKRVHFGNEIVSVGEEPEAAAEPEAPAAEEGRRPDRYQGPPLSDEEIDTIVDVWKYVISVYRSPKPRTLTQFIIDGGGIIDTHGEISHLTGGVKGRPGLIRKPRDSSPSMFGPGETTNTIDDWALRAWEAGYFPDHLERPSVQEFLDALRDDLHEGNVVHPLDRRWFEDQRIANEMAEELLEYGFRPNDFRKEETLRAWLGQRPDKRRKKAAQEAPRTEAQEEDAAADDIPFDVAPAEPEAKPEPQPSATERDRPVLLSTGDRLRSKSGRELSPVPKIDMTSDGRARNSIARMDRWLRDEALKEVEAEGNNYQRALLQAIDLKNVSPADRDTMNLILFGDADGPSRENFITDEPKAEKPEKKPSRLGTTLETMPQQDPGKVKAAVDRVQGEKPELHVEATGPTSLVPPPTTQEQIRAEADKRGKPKRDQEPMDIGLFGSDKDQIDLVDLAKNPAETPFEKASREAKEYVVSKGKETDIEHGVIVRPDGSSFFIPTDKNKRNWLELSPELAPELFDDGARTLELHHNHPSSSSFSCSDIAFGTSLRPLKTVYAHGHNGNSFKAEYLVEAAKADNVRNAFRKVEDRLTPILRRAWQDGRVEQDVANTYYYHLISMVLDEVGIIRYTASFADQAAAKAGVAKLREIIGDEWQAAVSEAKREVNVSDRRTGSVRVGERVEGAPARAPETGSERSAGERSGEARPADDTRDRGEQEVTLTDDERTLGQAILDNYPGHAKRLMFTKLRAAVPSLSKQQFDKAILSLQRKDLATIYRMDNQVEITDADREAAVVIGMEPRHFLFGDAGQEARLRKALSPPVDIAQGFDPAKHVERIAGGIEKMRKADLERLFKEAPHDLDAWTDLRVYIAENRQDLIADALDTISALGGLPKTPEQIEAQAELDKRRAERAELNARIVPFIQAYLAKGNRVVSATQYRVTTLTSPDHIRLAKDGTVQIREGTKWVTLFDNGVDDLARQAGWKEDRADVDEKPEPPLMDRDERIQAYYKANASPLEKMRDRLIDEGFKTIVEARKFARENHILGTNKEIDEFIESAIVAAARTIVQERTPQGLEPKQIYKRLVNLYERQPNLGTRTATSVANQAYSTPVPLAYLASRLAGVAQAEVVFEPTAGNGALLIEVVAPGKAHANEIDPARANQLRRQGFTVTEEDATEGPNLKEPADSVIMNPPFGVVREDGRAKEWEIDGWKTSQVDHAIALTALKQMADNGRAVLILGGVKAESVEERRKGYRGQAKREFYWRLYNQYNVVDHFTVDGELYKKQGAGWPVDVIVIEGKGKSARPLPASLPPIIFKSWESLAEKLPDDTASTDTAASRRPDRPARDADLRGARPEGRDEGTGTTPAGRGPDRLPSESGDDAVPVRADGDRGKPADVRGRRDDGLPVEPQSDRDGRRADKPAAAEQLGSRVDRPKRPKGESKGGQAYYEPRSKARSLDTLIPVNMADAATEALRKVGERRGAIDEFVAERLGYPGGAKSNAFLNAFSAEQVDAIASAIDNIERGSAFIIGDQTGIGKGRINAALLRYAIRQGKIPVLVTEKPDLYGDMWRDMRDIGLPEMLGREPRIFITNTGASIPLDEAALEWKQEADEAKEANQPIPKKYGKFLTGGGAQKQLKDMEAIARGESDYDVVFTTYDQMNTVKGQDTARRQFLMRIAPRALISFDESHNAGGAGQSGWKKKDGPMNRAEFARQLAHDAWGVMFSSATYAKRPEVMDLYARTDMGKAVDSPDELPELIARGGVPMQQIVASMLTQAGQYMRRERSFDGVEYALEGVAVNEVSYENFSNAVRAVFEFDLAVTPLKKDIISNILDEIGATSAKDQGVGSGGAHSVSFGSVMHNIVNQMLLSIKADAVADRAIRAHKEGEKPVIALASTMEAFITDFAQGEGINFGDPLDLTFRDVLARYLRRTLRITVKHPDGKKEYRQIPVESLPTYLQRQYRDALDIINEGDYAGLPISPIDWIRHRLSKAGLRAVEVTGRQTMVDYSEDVPVYTQRPTKERGPTGKRASIAAFNRGDLDVLIINRSGSTGVSMHASTSFKDQRRRRMLIAQAEANIDTHLQTLGRVHRTGQVIPPAYSQIAAEIPAEARPAAVLMKKMASLNANTTGARGSAFMADSVDFINEVGDEVTANIILENPALLKRLGEPLEVDENGRVRKEGAARIVTGRLTLLPPKEQAELLDRIVAAYTAELEHLDQTGENPLEAKTLDLQARTLEVSEIKPKVGDSPFLEAVNLERVSIKSQGRAMTPDEVASAVAEAMKVKRPDQDPAVSMRELEQRGRAWARAKMEEVGERARNFIEADVMATSKDARENVRKRHEETLHRWMATMQITYPGARVMLNMPAGEQIGVVMSVERTGKAKNPVAPGAWEVRIAVPAGDREFKFPMSKLFPPSVPKGDSEKGAEIKTDNTSFAELMPMFDEARREGRENRYIFTGNLLAAFDQTGGKGRIIIYSTEDGTLRPGILMGREFSHEKFMAKRKVRLLTAEQIMRFMELAPDVEVKSADGFVRLKREGGGYELAFNASRAKGGKYYTDSEIRKALHPQELEKRQGWMIAEDVPRAAYHKAIARSIELGALFEVREAQDTAMRVLQEFAPKQEQLPVPEPKQSKAGQKIRDFKKAVDALKTDLGVQTRPIDPEQGFKEEDPSTALTSLKDALQNLKKRSALRIIAEHVANYVVEAERILGVYEQQGDIDLDEATSSELREFLGSLSDLAQIIEAQAQKGYALSDDVIEAREDLYNRLFQLSDTMDDLEQEASDWISELSALSDRLIERMEELGAITEEEEETGTSLALYESRRSILSTAQRDYDTDPEATFLSVGQQEVVISRGVLQTLSERVEELLDVDIDNVDLPTLRRTYDRATDLFLELSAVREWTHQFSLMTVKKADEAYEFVERLHEEKLTPAIDKIDEAQSNVQERMEDVEYTLINKEEIEAGQTIEVAGEVYGPTRVREMIEGEVALLELLNTRLSEATPEDEARTRQEITLAEERLAELRKALGRYEAEHPDGGAFMAAMAASDVRMGREMRRSLDALGFYSQALEAAKALKQAKGTPQQMLAQLKSAGVKDAEIRATGLDRFLENKRSVTRDEIVRHLEENRVSLREVVRGTDPGERTLLDAAAREWWGAASFDDLPGEVQASVADTVRARTGLLATRWSHFSLDPQNPSYRETVLHLPGGNVVANFPKAERDQLALDHFDKPYDRLTEDERAVLQATYGDSRPNRFQSSHFPEPDIVAHARTSLVEDEQGRIVFNIDELQSDWAQKIRDGGTRDEEKIAQLEARREEIEAKIEHIRLSSIEAVHIRPMDRGSGYGEGFYELQIKVGGEWHRKHGPVTVLELEGDPTGWTYVRNNKGVGFVEVGRINQEFDDLVAESDLITAEIRTAQAATTSHPLVNTTDQWVTTALRRLIRQAVEAGADAISLTPGVVQTVRFSLASEIPIINVDEVRGMRRVEPRGQRGTVLGVLDVRDDGTVVRAQGSLFNDFEGKPLRDVFGKDVADAIMAVRGKDAIATGDLRIGGEGMIATYDGIYPRTLGKILSKLDKSIKPEKRALRSPGGQAYRHTVGGKTQVTEFTTFPLTDLVKAKVREEGQALFAVGRRQSGQLADRVARRIARSRVNAGGAYEVPSEVTDAILNVADSVMRFAPKGVKAYALTRLRRHPDPRFADDYVVASFRASDGSTGDIAIPNILAYSSRALFHRNSRSVLLTRFVFSADLGPTIAGEVWHELVHASRSVGVLEGRDWSRLVRHAYDLGVLNIPLDDYLRFVGDPSWQEGAPSDETVHENYLRLYADLSNLDERIDQEAAAHLVELASHGLFTDEQLAPVRDILQRLASGELAKIEPPEEWEDPLASDIPPADVPADQQAEIAERLTEALNIINRIAGKEVEVEFYDTIPAEQGAGPAQRRATERTGLGTGTAGGFYRRGKLNARALIGLATQDPAFDLRTAAGHEAWHHVEEELATEAELRLLNSPAEMARMRQRAAEEIGLDPRDPRLAALPAQEIRAIAFQRYRRLREEGAQPGGIHIGVRRFWDRVLRIFHGVANLIRGYGFGSHEALFEQARRGALARREPGLTGIRDRVMSWLRSRGAPDDFARYEAADTLEAFAATRFERDPASRITTIEAYRAYVRWAVRNAEPLMTEREFMDWLQEHRYRVKEVDGLYRIIGVRWTPTGEFAERVNAWRWGQKASAGASYIPDMVAANEPFEDKYAEAVARQIERRKGVRQSSRGEGPMAELEQQIEEAHLEVPKHRPGTPEWIAAVRRLDELRLAYDRMRGMRPLGVIEGDVQGSLLPNLSQPAVMARRARRMLARAMNRLDLARIKLQDRVLPVRRVQEAIEEDTGSKIPLNLDVYVAEAIYHGRAGERLTDLQTKYIEPLIQRLRSAGIKVEELGEYLYARHAAERNETIRNIDPNNDSGSGMTDAEAADILRRIANSGKLNEYREAAKIIDEMIEDARRTLLRGGLISREQYDEWRSAWAYYVPLRGFEFTDEDATPDRPRVGRGFDVRGREAYRALGRRSKADNPVVYAVLQAQQAVIRAEKNRVDKTLFKLIQAHPDPSLWKIYKGEYRRRVNPDTGLVEKYWVPPAFVRKDNVHGVKIGGKQYWFEIKHPALARAIRGAGSEMQGTIIGRFMFKAARTYATMLTAWNPEFLFSNLFRDVETAIINIGDIAEKPVGLRRKMVKEALSAKAIRGAFKALRGDKSSEYARWFEEFRLAGGKISFMEFNDVERIRQNINKSLTQGRIRRSLSQTAKLIEDLNTAVENGVRLSVYKALRENGVPQDRAAFVARELTVNFNRKGEWGPAINAAYLFFNASVQGTTRMAQAVFRSKPVRYAVGAIFGTGFALDILNYLLADEDDDGQNAYDKIPLWVKERNLIVMLPGHPDNAYIQIPLAYGYNVPYLAGQQLASVLRGAQKPLHAAASMAASMFEAFNPVGSASYSNQMPNLYQIAAPTFADPVVQVLENRTWYGAPIYPTKFDNRQPWSETYFASAPWWAKELAQALNRWSGGNPARPGLVDISPEVLEHYGEFLAGGVGKFFLNVWATGERIVTGDEWLPEQTPFVRRLYGKTTTTSRRREFYDAWNEVDQAYYEVRELAKDGDTEGSRAAREQYAAELEAYSTMKATYKDLKTLQKRRERIDADPNLSRAEKMRQREEIIKTENGLIQRAIGVYNRALKEHRQ